MVFIMPESRLSRKLYAQVRALRRRFSDRFKFEVIISPGMQGPQIEAIATWGPDDPIPALFCLRSSDPAEIWTALSAAPESG